MKFSFRAILLSLLLSLSSVTAALAFELKPMSRDFSPTGDSSTQSYEVVNSSDKQVAVEISMKKRQMDVNGTESYEDANDDFLVYPTQILLEPGSSQTVRVTWLGDPQPTSELAYRMVADQLPVQFGNASDNTANAVGQISILMHYIGSVYIHPEGVKPDVILDEIVPQVNPETGVNELVVTFHNQGLARTHLNDLKLRLTAAGTTIELSPEQLSTLEKQIILAGNRRRFVIPYPENLPAGTVTATFAYTPD